MYTSNNLASRLTLLNKKIKNKKADIINKINFLNRYYANKKNIKDLYDKCKSKDPMDDYQRADRLIKKAKTNAYFQQYILKFARCTDSFVAKMIYLCAIGFINTQNVKQYYFYKQNEFSDINVYLECDAFRQNINSIFFKTFGKTSRSGFQENIKYRDIYNSTIKREQLYKNQYKNNYYY